MDRLGQHQSAAGSASRPTGSWEDSKTTGWYRIGADNIGFAVATTKLLDLGSALVGITGALTVSTTTTLAGVVSVDDTTDTTSTTTGSIHTDGGLGVAKALWVGTTSRLVGAVTMDAILSVDDTTETTSAITGSIHTDGGLGVAKNLWVAGDFVITGGGPHAVGIAPAGYDGFRHGGNFTSDGSSDNAVGWSYARVLTGAVGDTVHLSGAQFRGEIITQGTDTNIGVTSTVYIEEPRITNNLASAGAPDVASALYVKGAPTEGDVNAAIYVKAGDVSTDGGTYTMLEITTPTARANYGKLYCKSDNALYFQDGAGVEHTVTIS
jgi:hypothetical protein